MPGEMVVVRLVCSFDSLVIEFDLGMPSTLVVSFIGIETACRHVGAPELFTNETERIDYGLLFEHP